MNTFGELIRTKREEQNLLLRHLSAMVDMDTALLSKIERGERIARLEQVERLAKELNMDLIELKSIWLADKIVDMARKNDNGLEILNLAIEKITNKITNEK